MYIYTLTAKSWIIHKHNNFYLKTIKNIFEILEMPLMFFKCWLLFSFYDKELNGYAIRTNKRQEFWRRNVAPSLLPSRNMQSTK